MRLKLSLCHTLFPNFKQSDKENCVSQNVSLLDSLPFRSNNHDFFSGSKRHEENLKNLCTIFKKIIVKGQIRTLRCFGLPAGRSTEHKWYKQRKLTFFNFPTLLFFYTCPPLYHLVVSTFLLFVELSINPKMRFGWSSPLDHKLPLTTFKNLSVISGVAPGLLGNSLSLYTSFVVSTFQSTYWGHMLKQLYNYVCHW